MNYKKMIALFSLVFTTSIFSAEFADSWDDIRSNPHLRVRAPEVAMQHEFGTASVSVFDVCMQGDWLHIKDTKGLVVCVPKRGLPNRASCSTERVWPVAPVFAAEKVCTQYSRLPLNRAGDRKCLEWTAVTIDHSQAHMVEVYEFKNPREYGRRAPIVPETLFEKEFYIPACL